MSQHTLLVCTVGGTPQAVAAAIKGCQPDRVIFIVSPQTCQEVEGNVLPMLGKEGIALSVGQYEIAQVADAQDFTACVERVRELSLEVEKWQHRGPAYRVIADFTGGTKGMSAALALVARRWPCFFSYVGGSERTKDGVGIVVNGQEKILHTQNPWDSLGYQAVEEAMVLFNGGDYQAAIHVLDSDLGRIERADLKERLSSLKLLAEAYLDWDLFTHQAAYGKLRKVHQGADHLRYLFPADAEGLLSTVKEHLAFLPSVKETSGRHVLLDLCANARRCAVRGRYDDAVARLYRTMEATAQLRLRERYDIADTAEVPLERVPEPLRWAGRAREGTLFLGLQEDYQLLEALGDELGQKFKEMGLAGEKSPLSARNQSILAHGFTPVGEKVFSQLWIKTLALAGIAEGELPVFPRLGSR